ncbi:MAG: Omp28-related outer membrane protein [Chitinophagales bacterium]|nr:Omp28-related outer membrane protein [Chitinophagales bacterium]
MKKVSSGFLLMVSVAMVVAQSTIYTQNFSTAGLPAGWTNVDNTGSNPTAGIWQRRTTFNGFASSTASNGFYVFISDAQSNDNKPEDGSLTTSAINCLPNSHVAIQFEQNYYTYFSPNTNSTGKLLVSNDGTTWNEVYSINKGTDNPELVTVDLTPYAANQTTVYLRFNFTGSWDGWWAIDDIKLFEPLATDVAVSVLDLTKYVSLSDQPVKGTLTNNGYNAIGSVDLSYTVNGGAQVTQSFSGLNIQPFSTYNFQFSQKVAMSTAQVYDIVVTSSNPNNTSDANPANDSKNGSVAALSAIPQKNVLIEEFTTAPCQFCTDGAVVIEDIVSSNSFAIPVGIHAGFGTDAMTTTEASALASAFANGAPTANIDRVYYKGQEKVGISRNIWETKTIERHTQVTPAKLSGSSTYDAGTRALSVTVNATFFTEATGDFRINCYIVEDSVSGTGSGYNQVNYYNTQSGHPYYGKGNPIIGYQHRHVERTALGGTWGSTGVIPATTVTGTDYTKTYTYTLPAGWNANRCHVVAFVHEYSSNYKSNKNEIYNAIEIPFNETVSQTSTPAVYTAITETGNPLNNVLVYPNPAKDVLYVEYTIAEPATLSFDITNMIGQSVYATSAVELGAGSFRTPMNISSLENGVYFVSVKNEAKTVNTYKVIINK